MSKFKFTRESRRIFELSHQLNDTELSEDEGTELNKLLKNNPEGQLIFLSLRDQDLSLSDRLQNRSIHEKTLGESEPKKKTDSKSHTVLYIIVLTLIAFIAFFLFKNKSTEVTTEENTQALELTEPYRPYIASISSSIDVVDPKFKQGQDLKTGWLKLDQGMIVIELDSAMELNITAPAEIELQSGNKIFIKKGKVRLTSLIKRKGFAAFTQHGQILDQGADFGVNIQKHKATATCFLGSISFSDDSFKKIIHENQTFSLITKQLVDAESYLSTKSIHQQSKDRSQSQLLKWQELIKKLKTDPDTAFMYQFKPNPHDDKALIQEVYRGEVLPAHGKIIGATWAEGRFPTTHSLKFQRPNDRVKFFLNEKFPAMTMNLWVKFEHLTNNNHLGVLLSEKWEPNEFTVQLQTVPQGSFFKLSSKSNFTVSSDFFNAESILKNWILLSFTFDIEKKEFFIYINGEDVTSQRHIATASLQESYMGWCDLMNWVPLNSQDIRNAPGQVDFLSIHRSAFSPKEIKQFYQESKTP
ncbi:hypothetical protein PQO03_01595 [Lentisphaera profundi]|uniref:FecR protein domain-containing protein n=1 Tax=Lentisphaera profundi TaxID=1658616 RepID=A0ABY7VRZ1_9BACT|nr:hypothetical protein [Lentisphaera profundi]WDE96661.1 hypothetical protein PQO03_01595 [Lentisphaera profundi]